MKTEAFFDTNVLLYIPSAETEKAERARRLVEQGGVISVQVLDEVASVSFRKIGLGWPIIRRFLAVVRESLEVAPTDLSTHELGLDIAERYRISVYDSMLLAAALESGCTTFWSEDLHNGQLIEGQLTIRNPFA
ncbi:MAG: PIN domain-containing protein [Ignavibacteriales bacterium]